MQTSSPAESSRRTWLVLGACLLVQAALLTHRPDLLPAWGDEQFTLATVVKTPAGIFAALQRDIHPPLYFLLGHYLLKIPWGPGALVSLRMMSALFALGATVVLDRCWLRHAAPRLRLLCLALWTLSPCVLLYARMARSYSLQALTAMIACWAALGLASALERPGRWIAWVLSVDLVLYTHYLPGLAVWIGSNLLLILINTRAMERRGGVSSVFTARLLAANAAVALIYLPWLRELATGLLRWQSHSHTYELTQSGWKELVLKAGYGAYSFLFGESIPIWLLPVSAVLALPCLWLVLKGILQYRPPWMLAALAGAGAAFLGASRWVSYPFMGARLLFLLPLFLLALAAGALQPSRAGPWLATALLAANVAGIWSYFQARDLINVGYLIHYDRIIAEVSRASDPRDTLVLVDGLNLDALTLGKRLRDSARVTVLDSSASIAKARETLADPSIRHVWLIRNAHDISPGGAIGKLEEELLHSRQARLHPYVPLSATDRALIRAAAWMAPGLGGTRPRFEILVWEFRR